MQQRLPVTQDALPALFIFQQIVDIRALIELVHASFLLTAHSVCVQTSRTFACRDLRSRKVSGRLVSSRRSADG